MRGESVNKEEKKAALCEEGASKGTRKGGKIIWDPFA